MSLQLWRDERPPGASPYRRMCECGGWTLSPLAPAYFNSSTPPSKTLPSPEISVAIRRYLRTGSISGSIGWPKRPADSRNTSLQLAFYVSDFKSPAARFLALHTSQPAETPHTPLSLSPGTASAQGEKRHGRAPGKSGRACGGWVCAGGLLSALNPFCNTGCSAISIRVVGWGGGFDFRAAQRG